MTVTDQELKDMETITCNSYDSSNQNCPTVVGDSHMPDPQEESDDDDSESSQPNSQWKLTQRKNRPK